MWHLHRLLLVFRVLRGFMRARFRVFLGQGGGCQISCRVKQTGAYKRSAHAQRWAIIGELKQVVCVRAVSGWASHLEGLRIG